MNSAPEEIDKYYYPLIRSAFFVMPSKGPSGVAADEPGSASGVGLATRAFLGEEKDVGRIAAGRYFC